MKVLSYGRPFGTPGELLSYYQSSCGYEVRQAGYEGEVEYPINAGQTVEGLIQGITTDWCPDLMLCWCPELVPPPLAIEEVSIPVVAVVSDWTVYGPQLKYNLSRYDAVVIDKLGAEKFHPYGISPQYIAPLYAHRSGVHQDLGIARDIDIAFAGNLNHAVHVRRGRLLERVARLSDRYKVVIASELDTAAYTELLNRSRIVFNFGLRGEMNLRCFEALVCRALLFVEEDNLEVGDWLRNGEEAVFYREDNLEELLATCLADPESSARIAAQGHAAMTRLSGEARLDAFFDAVTKLPHSGRPFGELSPRDRALAEIMQYASSALPGHSDHVLRCTTDALATWPEDVAFKIAATSLELGRIAVLTGDERETVLRGVLATLRDCATTNSEEVVGWLNLAFVTKLAGVAKVEQRFLELALQAGKVAYGDLLFGARMDPYYQRWREALAFGEESIDVLHAGAASRLAELHLTAGDAGAAKDYAERSIALAPRIAPGHLALGKALLAEGNTEDAVTVLRNSLELTALDSTHRNALIDALEASGAQEDAHAMAEDSAAVFAAWPAAVHVAQAFRERSRKR